MTTWHDQEPLDEALWFFLRSAFPAEHYASSCRSGVVLIIGADGDRETLVRETLRDPVTFAEQVENRLEEE